MRKLEMQKKLIALAVAAAVAAPMSVAADVKIYGKMHASWDWTDSNDNANDDSDDSTGVFRASRLGFKGSEDLGGGLSAIWQVETQVNSVTARLKLEEVDLFLFHQANLRINEYVAQQLEIDLEKCPSNIERYGNCSAASIPMLLDECVREGRIRAGQLISLTTFGSGFSWSSALIRW